MRGSALRASGRAETPRAPRGLAGDRHPRAPRPGGALPLVGPPAKGYAPQASALKEPCSPRPQRTRGTPPFRPIPGGPCHEPRQRKARPQPPPDHPAQRRRARRHRCGGRARRTDAGQLRPSGASWRTGTAPGPPSAGREARTCAAPRRAGPHRRQHQPDRPLPECRRNSSSPPRSTAPWAAFARCATRSSRRLDGRHDHQGQVARRTSALAAHLGNAEKNERVALLETKGTIAQGLARRADRDGRLRRRHPLREVALPRRHQPGAAAPANAGAARRGHRRA